MYMVHSNITLIGMPASGKSEVGRRIAPRIGYEFIDVDDMMVGTYGSGLLKTSDEKPIHTLMTRLGQERFMAAERDTILGIHGAKKVISPGGSCVYYEDGMRHLMGISYVVFLDVPEDVIIERMRSDGGVDARAIINLRKPTEDGLRDLYLKRHVLYEYYADYRFHAGDEMPEHTTERLERHLRDAEILL